jgi:SAM-dependent methyltransferase
VAQNIYDDPKFFDNYRQMERSVRGIDGAAEWPLLRAMLPDLRGRRIVDLGCGFGWFCRWAHEQGAANILGLDLSDKMLETARESTDDGGISYARADLEQLRLPSLSFDLAYSALALHYVENLSGVFACVQQTLVARGHFIFSVEHPIFTAPSNPAWSIVGEGRKIWPLDGYSIAGPRETDWLDRRVIKFHRPLGTYINALAETGFTVVRVHEWGPTDRQLADRPEWAEERNRPLFLAIAARRCDGGRD